MGDTLVAVGGAFLAAGLLARAGRRVGLPTIPFFMAAGIIFGPNTPGLALVEDPRDLELLAALGLILLLFHLGLEFSLNDLLAGGRRLLGIGAVYLVLNVGGGFLLGLALGWGTSEALVIAGAVGISSSAIVTKLLIELRRLANPESRLILGVIVVEDIFLALYLALLQPVLGEAEGPADALGQFAAAFAFLLALGSVARWGARAVGRLVASPDDELLTVCFVGLAVLVAGVAEELGVSDAIGAFMAGLVMAESHAAERIERLVLPLRDAFAATFFFAFGLTIDPSDAWAVAGPVAVAVVLSIVLNLAAGIIAARTSGYGRNAAANIGLTILGRGEFSLILATLATAAGLDARIGPFIALYVLVLAVLGPVLAARSPALARLLPARLFPRRAATQPALSIPGPPDIPDESRGRP
ncbi:MAG: cation:proton antiporter [Actinomycetota bacterium]|nr:cation:proton antiporter [Actinomycetota bacterium]